MSPSEVRAELLREHEEIRLMIETTRDAASRPQSSTWSPIAVTAWILRLAETVRTHNRHEEELLRGLLRTIDSWGPVRVEIMDEQHAHEHRQLVAALIEARWTRLAVKDALSGPLDKLLEHMAYEEKFLLAEELLRDDGVVTDQVDG